MAQKIILISRFHLGTMYLVVEGMDTASSGIDDYTLTDLGYVMPTIEGVKFAGTLTSYKPHRGKAVRFDYEASSFSAGQYTRVYFGKKKTFSGPRFVTRSKRFICSPWLEKLLGHIPADGEKIYINLRELK